MSTSPNQHIWDYLQYYVGLKTPPHFAVLLNGTWGSGKTFAVKKFLADHTKSGIKSCYVSLYGLSSSDEIDGAVLAALHPRLASPLAQAVGRTLISGVRNWGKLEVDIKKADLVKMEGIELYVFDDLERCHLDINQVLGHVNRFVEHAGRKVILVANEEEIVGSTEYRRKREKLVGKQFLFESEFEVALVSFLEQIDDADLQTVLRSNKQQIATIFRQSGLENLRILKYTIAEFERFFFALATERQQNTEGMPHLLRMFFAWSFELKSARVQPEDLRGRLTELVRALASKSEGEPSRIAAARARYVGTDLGETSLSDEVLEDILVKGIVEKSKIEACLANSPHFALASDIAPWRLLWHGHEIAEQDFYEALSKVEEQYRERAFIRIGEILHVFGIRLWLSDIGELELDRSQVVSEGISYISDVTTSATLETTYAHVRLEAWDGLGFRELKTPEFRQLREALLAASESIKQKRLPQHGAFLLEQLRKQPLIFVETLGAGNSSDVPYARIPVLAHVDPAEFCHLLLQQSPAVQEELFISLRQRYEHSKLTTTLADEGQWLANLRQQLLSTSRELSPIGRDRIKRYVAWHIDPCLKEWEQRPVDDEES